MAVSKVFGEQVVAEVRNAMGDRFDISLHEVTKNNGSVFTGLTIRKMDENIAPTVYLEGYEDQYSKQEKTIKEIGEDITTVYRKNCGEKSGFTVEELSNVFKDGEKLLDGILPKVVNTERNKEYLQNVPHVDFLDLSVVFVYMISTTYNGSGTASFTVTNVHAENLGIKPEQMYEHALENMKRDGYKIRRMEDVLTGFIGGETTDSVIPDGCPRMLVITNESKINGAAAMLWPELFEKACGNLYVNLWILPCSIHEVICIPKEGSVEFGKLRTMVSEINATQLMPEEILSDNVYIYRSTTGAIEIAEY